jgi:hypothetical protein
MPDTVTVASSAPVSLRIHDPAEYNEALKAGLPVNEPTVIKGANDPDALQGFGITEGVDGAVLSGWLKAHPEHEPIMHTLTDAELEQLEDATAAYGHEPGLEAAAKDSHNVKLNELGTDYDPHGLPAPPADKPKPASPQAAAQRAAPATAGTAPTHASTAPPARPAPAR